jgi:hypothetical protein
LATLGVLKFLSGNTHLVAQVSELGLRALFPLKDELAVVDLKRKNSSPGRPQTGPPNHRHKEGEKDSQASSLMTRLMSVPEHEPLQQSLNASNLVPQRCEGPSTSTYKLTDKLNGKVHEQEAEIIALQCSLKASKMREQQVKKELAALKESAESDFKEQQAHNDALQLEVSRLNEVVAERDTQIERAREDAEEMEVAKSELVQKCMDELKECEDELEKVDAARKYWINRYNSSINCSTTERAQMQCAPPPQASGGRRKRSGCAAQASSQSRLPADIMRSAKAGRMELSAIRTPQTIREHIYEVCGVMGANTENAKAQLLYLAQLLFKAADKADGRPASCSPSPAELREAVVEVLPENETASWIQALSKKCGHVSEPTLKKGKRTWYVLLHILGDFVYNQFGRVAQVANAIGKALGGGLWWPASTTMHQYFTEEVKDILHHDAGKLGKGTDAAVLHAAYGMQTPTPATQAKHLQRPAPQRVRGEPVL